MLMFTTVVVPQGQGHTSITCSACVLRVHLVWSVAAWHTQPCVCMVYNTVYREHVSFRTKLVEPNGIVADIKVVFNCNKSYCNEPLWHSRLTSCVKSGQRVFLCCINCRPRRGSLAAILATSGGSQLALAGCFQH